MGRWFDVTLSPSQASNIETPQTVAAIHNDVLALS